MLLLALAAPAGVIEWGGQLRRSNGMGAQNKSKSSRAAARSRSSVGSSVRSDGAGALKRSRSSGTSRRSRCKSQDGHGVGVGNAAADAADANGENIILFLIKHVCHGEGSRPSWSIRMGGHPWWSITV
jgi:hypothetical protein